MIRLKNIALAAIVVLCVAGLMSGGASAATKKGEIWGTKGTAPTKATFTGAGGAAAQLETVAGSKYECEKISITGGRFTSRTTGSATLIFTGCSSGGSKCKTTGALTGEIVLSVALLVTTSSNKQNVLILKSIPETDIKCATVDLKIRGSLFVKVLTELILSTEQQIQAKGQVGVQEPEETTNHLQASFAGKPFENASINTGVINVTFTESVDFV